MLRLFVRSAGIYFYVLLVEWFCFTYFFHSFASFVIPRPYCSFLLPRGCWEPICARGIHLLTLENDRPQGSPKASGQDGFFESFLCFGCGFRWENRWNRLKETSGRDERLETRPGLEDHVHSFPNCFWMVPFWEPM